MTRDEALMHLTVAYGHQPAVADFNIVAVNHVMDSLVQAEREACALKAEEFLTEPEPDWDGDFWNQAIERVALAIRARGQA